MSIFIPGYPSILHKFEYASKGDYSDIVRDIRDASELQNIDPAKKENWTELLKATTQSSVHSWFG